MAAVGASKKQKSIFAFSRTCGRFRIRADDGVDIDLIWTQQRDVSRCDVYAIRCDVMRCDAM